MEDFQVTDLNTEQESQERSENLEVNQDLGQGYLRAGRNLLPDRRD